MTDVEALARWMMEANERINYPERGLKWNTLETGRRKQYRTVAAELLANPPACLVASILAAEKARTE